jgi:LuxR family maltose regulon positive regulatory protein
LNQGLGHKLTLISAPAGFGKTTLVNEWVAECEQPVTWLSLDQGDNDLIRFLTYLIAALQTIKSNLASGALSALQSPQPPQIESTLTTLINEINALSNNVCLVLDDFHLIDNQEIHDALTFLIEHSPPQLHLVIATREDPLLLLPRIRARGQLIELRAADLRFTNSEAADFLNQVMGLGLSASHISALTKRTEGWIAGLQLAALSMQGRDDVTGFIQSFTGSNRLVLDYLIEEVLNQQPEDVQSFLMQTAILERLTSSLCDVVTGQSNSQVILENLERANIFIVPLDNVRHWYRYHHLFADLLRGRLQQTHPNQISILHSQASEWHEQNGFVVESIEHALQGAFFERAAHLIETNLGHNYEQVKQATLQRWLAAFPDEFIPTQPPLCILQAWTLFTTGQLDGAEQKLQVAEKMLGFGTNQELDAALDKGQSTDPNRLRLIGRIYAIRSFMVSFSGDNPTVIWCARHAIDFLPQEDLQWRSTAFVALGDAYANQGQMEASHQAWSDALEAGKLSGDPHLLMIINLRLAEILRQQGKLQQVIAICERQYKQAEEMGFSEWTIVGWLFGIWGEVLAEINDLDQALVQTQKGVELTARGSDLLYSVMSNLCLVRVLFSCGDLDGAEEIIKSVENSVSEHDLPGWALHQLSAWHVRIWLAQGKTEVAAQWMMERNFDPMGEFTYQEEVELIALLRILIAQEKLDLADKLLLRLLAAAEVRGSTDKVIEILILHSLVHQAGGDTKRAMIAMGKALSLAEPEGFIRIFVDEGSPVARLLYEAISREMASDYVQQLLAAFPTDEDQPEKPPTRQTPDGEWVEPLSDREVDVLQLMAEGLTNREIGIRLYLSTNTVKAHTRNIYGKLGVNNRTQAAAKARALGLLSSS